MRVALVLASALFASLVFAATPQFVEKPAALVADGVPPVPAELAARTRPYMEFRTASFLGWHPTDHAMLIATRFANTNQVHRVARPDGARQQLTFEEDRIADASHSHGKGDVTVVMKDVGGDEFFQLFTLANGRLSLLTDGKSRNEFGAWSRDGHAGWIFFDAPQWHGCRPLRNRTRATARRTGGSRKSKAAAGTSPISPRTTPARSRSN